MWCLSTYTPRLYTMKNSRLLPVVGASVALAAGVLFVAQNQAEAVAPVDAFPLPVLRPGASKIAIEGTLTALDAVTRVATINGTRVFIPAGVLIDTTHDGIGDITLDQLANPNLPTPVGGTMAVLGLAQSVNGLARFTASSVYWEFSENVVVGPLIAVDANLGMFQVNGTLVQMTSDPRFLPNLHDANGVPISVADLTPGIGGLVSAEGYLENGVLMAKVVEADVIAPSATDTVVIDRALYDGGKRTVEVRGWVTAHPATGVVVPSVQVDLGCDSIGLVTVTAVFDPLLGQGNFRYKPANNSVPTNPGQVCVRSANGGEALRNFN